MKQFTLIAGPCVIEDYNMCVDTALELNDIVKKYNFNYIFKSSFVKANRTSKDNFRGVSFTKAADVFYNIKKNNIKITTDVHETYQITSIKNLVDVVQIPAYLCRQTELIECAGSVFDIVNIKKGQFASAAVMEYAAEKVYQYYTPRNNKQVWLTERGTMFGYGGLIVDMLNIEAMKGYCDKVIFDTTHSCQGRLSVSGYTDGCIQNANTLTRSAIAAGCHGIFMEVHPNPEKAKSDASVQIKLSEVPMFIEKNILPYLREMNLK